MKLPSKILVIDDDTMNNLLCKLVLNRVFEGVDVQTFISPEEGVAYLLSAYTEASSEVSLLLFLDINMPIMTGWQVLDTLASAGEKLRAKLTIFMLSSSVDQKDKDQATSNPLVSGFISKPLTKDNLASIVSREIQ